MTFYTQGIQKEQRVNGIRQGWIITPQMLPYLSWSVKLQWKDRHYDRMGPETRPYDLMSVLIELALQPKAGWVLLARTLIEKPQ